MRALLRRLLHSLLLLAGVSVLSFLFFELAPGDYLDGMRLDPGQSRESLERLRAEYGLDRSLPRRYFEWLASVARGDFGYSFSRGAPVGELLWGRAANTLLLTGVALVLTWGLALPLGVWSAARAGGAADRLVTAATSVLLAVPDLLLGLLALLVALRVSFLPVGGMVSLHFAELGPAGRIADLLRHLALPAAALVLSRLPTVVVHLRSALIETLDAPFLHSARGRGVGRRDLLLRHALKPAANPLATLFGLSLAGLVSGSLVIEVLLGWPGLGPLLLDAILARDAHLVIGSVLLSSVFLLGGNLVGDALLLAVDPRTRAE